MSGLKLSKSENEQILFLVSLSEEFTPNALKNEALQIEFQSLKAKSAIYSDYVQLLKNNDIAKRDELEGLADANTKELQSKLKVISCMLFNDPNACKLINDKIAEKQQKAHWQRWSSHFSSLLLQGAMLVTLGLLILGASGFGLISINPYIFLLSFTLYANLGFLIATSQNNHQQTESTFKSAIRETCSDKDSFEQLLKLSERGETMFESQKKDHGPLLPPESQMQPYPRSLGIVHS